MKRTKKNNKGFSLVELIVVVLIMAIIAVALAPQVMKWVNESRKSADASTYDSVVAAAQDALANENVWKEVTGGADFTITINNTEVTNGGGNLFKAEFNKQIGGKPESIKLKQSGATATVTIKADDGTVERTKEPGSAEGGN